MKRLSGLISINCAGACALMLCGPGCAGEKPGPHVAPQAGHATPARPKGEAAVATSQTRRSVFALDASFRDPFFPQPRRTQEPGQGPNVPPPGPVDVGGLLTAGLQGIGGTAERRFAILNNILLEPGMRTQIPIRVNNQERRLSVKCREITKNTVAIDVEGYGQVVVKAKSTL